MSVLIVIFRSAAIPRFLVLHISNVVTNLATFNYFLDRKRSPAGNEISVESAFGLGDQ